MSDKVWIFDTTLRDGEQAAGCRLGTDEKLRIARQLAALGVDIIEAGFPCSSPLDFESVKRIAAEIRGPTICGLSRAVARDIDVCAEALKGAARARIHTGIGVSDVHIRGKFSDAKYGDTLDAKKDRVREMAVQAVKHARGYVDDVEFYAEDAGRADRAFLFSVLEAAIEAGATVVNIPDTTGYAVPEQYGALIREIRERVPNIARAVISVHCHDDLGMAVANSLAGVRNGARQVEGTINGIGERAGNAAIEEVAMALRTRRDYFGPQTGLNTREFYLTSRMVADAMDMPVPRNKAVVGANAFSHSSGIHVDGVLKDRETYEIMRPEDVGLTESRIVLTARTGRHGLKHRLDALGYRFGAAELDQVYERFLTVADRKREVYDEDLIAIVHDGISPASATFRIEFLRIASETGARPTATVRLLARGELKEETAQGDGPVDAVYRALSAACGLRAELTSYRIQAATSGPEAVGEAFVHLRKGGCEVVGRGASTDIIEASARAYVDGLNRLLSAGAEAAPAHGV